ncbi:MRC1-like domain-containing protein [Pyrenochaeta sp. MPI-SDFR-AT-0127]|nr:MRC1-like domain-containing protein [Pyrenochaeta sp. MPI-SDFR-AT-0127]
MASGNESTIISSESARSPPSTTAIDASRKPRPKLLAALRKPATESSGSDTESDHDDSMSGDDASALSRNVTPTSSSRPQADTNAADDEEESDGGAAYERMKKRLAANKNAAEVEKTQKALSIATTLASSEDEDEMPVRTTGRVPVTERTASRSPFASPSPRMRSQRSSPGLFVTPNASPAAKKQRRISVNVGSDSDSSSGPVHNASLQERVRRIRAERLAKQQEEENQHAKPTNASRRRVEQASGSDSDGENGRRLTQQAKPTRKAGKKAMEAMARDQQRISRNMQLTHQAKTKKRYSTKDLFARMGYNAPNELAGALPTPDPSSALSSSDAEANQPQDTPPTSPPAEEAHVEKNSPPTVMTTTTALGQKQDQDQDQNEPPVPAKIDKGKGRAPEFQHLPLQPWMKQTESVIVQNAQVDGMVELSDSEDEHQVASKPRFPVFDRMPTKVQHESASLLRLRALAQLAKSPQKGKKGQKRVTLAEMEHSLAEKARQQKNKGREERIAELKLRGRIIETEEEREKHQMEIEDMVAQFEKQRQEDLKLSKLERDEAKKNGETIDDLPSSDESDDDYVGSGEENANEQAVESEAEIEIELSGSEDEEMDEDEDPTGNSNVLIDAMADEDDEPEEAAQMQQDEEDADMEDEAASAPTRTRPINRVRNRVIDDEDEDENDEIIPQEAIPTQQATQDNTMAAFGFGNANTTLGLTQMFAGTMANLESDSQSTPALNPEPEQDSLDFLRSLPATQPGANFSQASDFIVPNSQSLFSPQKDSQPGLDTEFSLGISQLIKTSPAFSRTQLEDFEPTQDAGFSFSRSPAGLVPPPSTADTVMMAITESPVKQRKGKLQRGLREAAVELSDVEEDLVDAEEQESEDDIQRPPKPSDVFLKMKKAAKKQKAIDEFNKKTSMAKEAVMEQAEESEDEYAGLGGASDDEEGEEDEDLKDMIDHNDVNVDERQIAAFFADKSKKEDEKNIADLYKKIQTGGLRRQAAGRDAFDLSDSEDEAERRQRKKRAAFQKQTNELLKNERIAAISKDDKKKAFFNTLADFADEGDYDFLDMPAQLGPEEEQSQSQEGVDGEDIAIPDSQVDADSMPAPFNPLKRKSPDSQKENRPPPHLRRTAASDSLARKPITFADVQNSVSELLEDPRVIVPDSQYSESEDDEESPAPSASSRKPIVDRMTLSRTPTLESQQDSNMAFHASSRSATAPGFRIPSLIRRATSNVSATSESRSSSGTNTPTESAVRRGGTGRSNIHAQAREAERRALLEKKDGKRKEALRKKVEGGRKRAGGMRSVLGDLGGGFE